MYKPREEKYGNKMKINLLNKLKCFYSLQFDRTLILALHEYDISYWKNLSTRKLRLGGFKNSPIMKPISPADFYPRILSGKLSVAENRQFRAAVLKLSAQVRKSRGVGRKRCCSIILQFRTRLPCFLSAARALFASKGRERSCHFASLSHSVYICM